MSKSETISALMDSAATEFAVTGYEGASLRDIASGAGVPLSTINLYFGTKADLFIAVMAHTWHQVNKDRTKLLAARLAEKGGAPDLRDIAYALVKPVVDRARSTTASDPRFPRLLRQWVGAPPEVKKESQLRDNGRQSLGRWIDSVARACPELSKTKVVWGFSFIVGALYSWELMDYHYDEVTKLDETDPNEIVHLLVEFAVAGMTGLAGVPEQTQAWSRP